MPVWLHPRGVVSWMGWSLKWLSGTPGKRTWQSSAGVRGQPFANSFSKSGTLLLKINIHLGYDSPGQHFWATDPLEHKMAHRDDFLCICRSLIIWCICVFQVSGGALSDFSYVALQTCSHLYPRWSRCCSWSLTHTKHRTDAEDTFHTLTGKALLLFYHVKHLNQKKNCINYCFFQGSQNLKQKWEEFIFMYLLFL